MRIQRVKVDDLYHDESNPREAYKGIAQLAATFENGEPYNPLIVYRDGNIFVVVDGNRRLEAMRHLDTEECNCIVLESQSEALKTCVQLATGTTALPLNEIEKSRGYQTALALDVPYDRIAAYQNTDAGKVGSFAKALGKVDDYAEDMSFDRLVFIAENELTDEQEARLMNCRESEWKSIAREYGEPKEERPHCPLCGATNGKVNWELWRSFRCR